MSTTKTVIGDSVFPTHRWVEVVDESPLSFETDVD
jgi:hypothetical protein